MFLSLKFKNLTVKTKVLDDGSAGSYRKNKIFKPKPKYLECFVCILYSKPRETKQFQV